MTGLFIDVPGNVSRAFHLNGAGEDQTETPSPVVQLEEESAVRDVVAQIDAHDRENPPEDSEESISASGAAGYALPDGRFYIADVEDLVDSIASYKKYNSVS